MPGFDPDQPRDEKGQWTSTGSSGAIQGAASDRDKIVAMKSKQLVEESDLAEKFSFFNETGIDSDATYQRENIMMELDSKMDDYGFNVNEKMNVVGDMIRDQDFESVAIYDRDGNLVSFNDGNEEEVSVGRTGATGGYMTHNHPYDQSFSNGDLNTTVQMGLKQMRVAAGGHDYMFEPNYDYSHPMGANSVQSNMLAMEESVWDEFESSQQRVLKGDIDIEEANKNFQHRMMLRFAKKTGGKYTIKYRDTSNVNPDRLEHSTYKAFRPETIDKLRNMERINAADDVNIAMRKLRKNLKKHM